MDEDFLKIFRFEVFQGNNTPLLNSTGIVMTRSCAKKYFGHENPIGKTVELTTGGTESNKTKFDYQVEAVLDDVPANSSLQFDILLPFRAFEDNNKSDLRSNWHWKASFHTFIEVQDDNVDLPSLAKMYKAIPEAARTTWHASGAKAIKYPLLRFSDLHFDAARQNGYALIALKVSDKSQLFILMMIGIAIWLGANKFLENYEYRLQLSFSPFSIPCIVLLLIAIVTMAYQTISAAKANPVDALKNE